MFNKLNNISVTGILGKEYVILAPVFKQPERWFHLRELAAEVGISPAGASKYLGVLSKNGILIEKRERKFRLFRGNQESILFREHRNFYMTMAVINSGLFEMLRKKYSDSTITLSFHTETSETSKDEYDNPKHCIDIFVISKNKSNISVSEYEKIIGIKINIITMNRSEFIRLREKSFEIFRTIINGIRLMGMLEV